MKDTYQVRRIPTSQTKDWILKKHYAHRMPSVQYAFGLFDGQTLTGIATYGPTCRSLNSGYGAFGSPLVTYSFELTRLCIASTNTNAASILVGRSLTMLPSPAFVVSYADGNMGHVGYVYQSTNWIYCGVTAKETIYIDTNTGKTIHPRTIVSVYGSRERSKLPSNIEVEKEMSGKHRYIYFVGDRRWKKKMKQALKYPILPYPKGDTKRYDASYEPPTQGLLL